MARSVKKRPQREKDDQDEKEDDGEDEHEAAEMKSHKESIAEDEKLHRVVKKAMKKVSKLKRGK